ncbi:MAG: 23S rRNA (adenine(2503)-C(2))-methyltransferase RlmN [Bacillota bacterium]|jgi:23S rRNA (adenine2503-C2)-methyltransferase|nr:23S rRNA (adenine(2503)-C(2))-methyltransferase RlmN [Bacillota bacterium]
MKKQDLKSLSRNELKKWFKKEAYPEFRAEQVFNWIYKNGVTDFAAMKNIPADLRRELEAKAYVKSNLLLEESRHADDGTIKFLWKLADGQYIESVYLPYPEEKRHSVCISSQVGCGMNCSFCATAKGGLVRNLTTGEIIDQVLGIQREISREEYGFPPISNVVFMGMGEPLANLSAVLKAVEILNDEKGFGIGMRRITISTCGLVPGIRELARMDLQLVLAISLNAPNNQVRDYLMPINKKYPIEDLLAAVRFYIKETKRRVTFEYILIDKINNSPDQARELANLLQGILCHVNLIPLNPVQGFDHHRPGEASIKLFRDILKEHGIESTLRQERGTGIEAACGQLRHLRNKR